MDVSGVQSSVYAMANVLKMAVAADTEMAMKLVQMDAEMAVKASKSDTIGQLLDVYA